MIGKHPLDVFFYPRSVAIVGATRNPAKPSYYITENLVKLGFTGKIYPINPNASEILGLKCYPSLKDVPDEVDLVISLVPAPATLNVVKECAEKGVKGIVVIAGGFSEGGEVGRELEKKISEILRKTGMRLLGPNTLSPINPTNKLIVSFRGIKELKKGSLAFCFQSGMYEPKLGWIFNGIHIGVSKIIDVGNKLDINEVDVLEYLSNDDETSVIAFHVEN
ncbi:MAG: CoA-binding protein, partial [Candidatus Bathyarchaeota archaeon]|nr:CoA-binding protein [Candidatus Bathyarchaeota archaeon]